LGLYPAIFSWESCLATFSTLKYFYPAYIMGLFLFADSFIE
jgi:hypothetical protein